MPILARAVVPAETPQRLITTFLGAYVRQLGGWVAVADLIRLMADLGVDEQSVRSSVSRLKRRGFLETEPHGRTAGYRLSDDALRILDTGDRRIYRSADIHQGEDWVLVLFSVPEALRHNRHLLRSRLEWLGFGNAAPGVWIAPAHVADEAAAMLEQLNLAQYATLFRSHYIGSATLVEMVTQWWDLEALGAAYDGFAGRFAPVLASWDVAPGSPRAAFADYISILTHWRRLPFLDPGLPAAVLPDGWEGHRARELFASLHERLEPSARDHVEAVLRPITRT